jgi:transposase
MYIGIDVHKSSCYITALDGKGEILTEGEMTKEELLKWASSLSVNDELAIEASTTSRNIYQKMKEMGLNVSVAHPMKIKLIGKSSKKTDRNDSFHLANLLRMDYLPLSYVPEKRYEEMRTICRYRASLGRRIARSRTPYTHY